MLTPGFGPPCGVHRMVTDHALRLSKNCFTTVGNLSNLSLRALFLVLLSVVVTTLVGDKTGRPIWISPFLLSRFSVVFLTS